MSNILIVLRVTVTMNDKQILFQFLFQTLNTRIPPVSYTHLVIFFKFEIRQFKIPSFIRLHSVKHNLPLLFSAQ